MNTYLDEKEGHKQEYNNKIKAIATGKTRKIRVIKKGHPVEQQTIAVKETSERSTSDTTGRLNEQLATLFDELSTFMTKRGEPFKSRAYQKAQESIVLYENDITPENYKEQTLWRLAIHYTTMNK